MTRRALVVGAATGDLTGVGHDVTTMQEILTGRGFEVRTLTEADATRDGILRAYQQLIADTAPPDAAFVYYSGHGGTARSQDTGQETFQFIVPTDFDQSGPADFRGILAEELSVLLARLLKATTDVTVMFDCCHAARMSRMVAERLRVRALPGLTYLDVAAHRHRQLAAGLDMSLLDPLGNRAAVRLVACAADASAFEFPDADGVAGGIFTDAFRTTLGEAGDLPITWATLIGRIRERVLAQAPEQRPEVEGDESNRLIFSTGHADPSGALPIVGGLSGRATIPAAALLSVGIGDTFAIMPAGAARVDDAAVIATATVDRMAGTTARVAVELRAGHDRLPLGACAFRTSVTAARWPVRLLGDDALLEPLRAELATAPLVRPAGPDDDAVLAEVEATDEVLQLRDPFGPLTRPVTGDNAGVWQILADLAGLSRAAALRALRVDASVALPAPLSVEWGRMVGSQPVAAGAGEPMHAGDLLYVRIRNESDRTVWIFVYDIGVTSSVNLLTDDSPSGRALSPGEEFVLGEGEAGDLEGFGLAWPDGAPGGAVRPETLLVIVTSTPQDLSALEQPAVGRHPADLDGAPGGSPLRQLLSQVTRGALRDVVKPSGSSGVRYAVHLIDFQLSDGPRPLPIDEPPDKSVLFQLN